jgi:hypothetical protein
LKRITSKMKTIYFSLLALLINTGNSSIKAQEDINLEPIEIILKEQQESFKKMSDILFSEAFVRDVEVFEGLPHQNNEELLNSELKKRNSFKCNGFNFYKGKKQLSFADTESLRNLLMDRESYRKYSGPKACGGFHPDFVIQFKQKEEIVTIQLCFGCSEARMYKNDRIVYCDLKNCLMLQAILEDYYDNRPDKQKHFEDILHHIETININPFLLSKTAEEKWLPTIYKINSDSLVEFVISDFKSKETILCQWNKTLNHWFIINRDTQGERKDDLPANAEKLKILLTLKN